jgi:hypothetical protein
MVTNKKGIMLTLRRITAPYHVGITVSIGQAEQEHSERFIDMEWPGVSADDLAGKRRSVRSTID